MPSLRSNKLFGQIKRTLRLKKYPEDAIQPGEIYDSLRSAQEQIFARINFERKYTVAIQPNVSEYSLNNLTSTAPAIVLAIPSRGTDADMAALALTLAGIDTPYHFFNTDQNSDFTWNGSAFV